MEWLLEQKKFSSEDIFDNGNRFLIGNGYMGIRGTLDEFEKEQLVAVNLAGIYDKVGDGWREPLNAPNPFCAVLYGAGKKLHILENEPKTHSQSLDFRYGIMSRETMWEHDGAKIKLRTNRFASMADSHILGQRVSIISDKNIELTIELGIDGDVWDIHGPHYKQIKFNYENGIMTCSAFVQGNNDIVAVAKKILTNLPCRFAQYKNHGLLKATLNLRADEDVTIDCLASVFTTNDVAKPILAVKEKLSSAAGYDEMLKASKQSWDKIWTCSAVEIVGDEEAERAVNYSLYHLNCAAPRGDKAFSIPARGLSAQTYKGAIFWDTEIFMLDYFLHTQPTVAKKLVQYRIETLDGAMEKAAQYGFRGAFYAWESQEGGYDACSDYNVTDVFTGRPVRTYFRDKQVHISAAVVWAIMHYTNYTSDISLLVNGGAKAIFECARFYWSLLLKPVSKERYEIHDVIGPDEYHERVNNNAYTNRMALYTFDSALAIAKKMEATAPAAFATLKEQLHLNDLLLQIKDAKDKLYIQAPSENGVIPQFDGYFALKDASLAEVRARLKDPREYWGGGNGVASDTQIIKQADVVTMLEMFHDEYDSDILKKNWEYYERRTEHGSSLSACMYAMLACRINRPDLAYPFFMKSATAEITGGGKQWAGLVYIGGSHPAAAGGAWKILAQAFAGLHIKDGKPKITPCLPKNWSFLKFPFTFDEKRYTVEISLTDATVMLDFPDK